jgi:NTP pyrophosphatase (non-canonical NTP hydrolase)
MGKSFDNDVMDGPPPDYFRSYGLDDQGRNIDLMVKECHGRSVRAGWYINAETGAPLERNVGEMLALIHSEVSEALEGYRKGLKDDHLPERSMVEVELADVLIRVFDLAGYLKLNLGDAYIEKLLYNATRKDHKLEARSADGGKKF